MKLIVTRKKKLIKILQLLLIIVTIIKSVNKYYCMVHSCNDEDMTEHKNKIQ